MTVVMALVGMLLVPVTIFIAMGLGSILVVIVSVAASLTLLPALLSLFGHRVNALPIPFVSRAHARFDEEQRGGFWDRVARVVMRAPVISLLLGGGLLVAAAVPLLGIHTGSSGVSTFPDAFESKKSFEILQEEFSAGLADPTVIVVNGPIDDPTVQGAIDRLEAALADDASFGVVSQKVNDARDLARLSVPIAGGDVTSDAAIAAVKRLRNQHIPPQPSKGCRRPPW